VGSVGPRAGTSLLSGRDGSEASVLEEYVGKSQFKNHVQGGG
jgi:hypothetical protein